MLIFRKYVINKKIPPLLSTSAAKTSRKRFKYLNYFMVAFLKHVLIIRSEYYFTDVSHYYFDYQQWLQLDARSFK